MSPATTRIRREPNHSRRRYWGMLALMTVVLSLLGTLVSLSAGIHPERNGAFAVVPRAPYKPAYDPIALAERGLPADSNRSDVLPASPTVRAIIIKPNHISVMAAGKEIRRYAFNGKPTNLAAIAHTVRDKSMIEEISSGQFVLRVALIARNTSLTIGSPLVSELRLVDQPSVFVGTEGGKLLFDGVTVRTIPSDSAASYYQPFVMATGNATMDAQNSRFTNLGWDWNASYGVSWVEGSTGTVTDSTFSDNFIGAYTSRATNMTFQGSTFRDNSLYGLDPHTNSSHLTIDHVTAEGNRAHGIIFSDHVTDSSIRNSTSRNNGENGIMMDKYSTGNRITGNTVTGNTGDGLVTATSGANIFTSNTVNNNRVGVRLDAQDAASSTVANNRIIANGLASEGITLTSSNAMIDNGGQWNWLVVTWTWTVAGLVLLLTAFLLAIASWRRQRNQPTPRPMLQLVH